MTDTPSLDTAPKQGFFTRLANPTRFISLVNAALPWLWGATILTLVAGFAIVSQAPLDYQQGLTVKIMYLHVPSAWLGMFAYAAIAMSALGTLVWRHPLADVSAKCAAPIGAVFTALALITGSVWGKPMWGTWWIWDARLTSFLILFFMYIGLIALWQAMEDQGKAAKLAAVFALVGSLNLPIIKFSVDWWNTLHQPASVFRMDGPTIHISMLIPLLTCALGFTLLFVTLHLTAMRTEIWQRRIRAKQMAKARGVYMAKGETDGK